MDLHPATGGRLSTLAGSPLLAALRLDVLDVAVVMLAATPEQSAGAAGALFSLAKSRLKPEEFSQVSSAVPGMATLLKAAPAAGSAVGTSGALSQLGGSAAGLAAAASAFSKLGLKPELVSKAVPILTQFVTKSGGANVGNLLAQALK